MQGSFPLIRACPLLTSLQNPTHSNFFPLVSLILNSSTHSGLIKLQQKWQKVHPNRDPLDCGRVRSVLQICFLLKFSNDKDVVPEISHTITVKFQHLALWLLKDIGIRHKTDTHAGKARLQLKYSSASCVSYCFFQLGPSIWHVKSEDCQCNVKEQC